MTEVEPNDLRATEGMKEFTRRFMVWMSARVRRIDDDQTMHELKQMVYDFRVWFKNRYGLTFPELVPVILPSIGEVKFYRRDLPDAEIHRTRLFMVTDLKKIGKEVPPLEIAAAIQRAWPHYRPAKLTDDLKERETIQ